MKYESIYSFKVLDEILSGNDVYIIDKDLIATNVQNAITKANDITAGILANIINHDNSDNRFEFFKIVGEKENE